eukprot:276926-Amphidinium_carterae.1
MAAWARQPQMIWARTWFKRALANPRNEQLRSGVASDESSGGSDATKARSQGKTAKISEDF